MNKSSHFRWMCLVGASLACLLITLTLGSAQTPNGVVAPAGPVPPEPIALGWKIAIVAAVALAVGTGLFFSVRSWLSSNLFDRQYSFPPVPPVALRLGGTKSGGSMATIVFVDRAANQELLKIQRPAEKPPR